MRILTLWVACYSPNAHSCSNIRFSRALFLRKKGMIEKRCKGSKMLYLNAELAEKCAIWCLKCCYLVQNVRLSRAKCIAISCKTRCYLLQNARLNVAKRCAKRKKMHELLMYNTFLFYYERCAKARKWSKKWVKRRLFWCK